MIKKTYVITVSRYFPKGHPRAGEETGFMDKMIRGEKIHTIRENYEYWKGISEKVNAGDAVLSVRVWKGVPYQSGQHEFMEVSSFEVQRVQILNTEHEMEITVEDNALPWVSEVAKNDGLSPEDFTNWFFPKKKIKKYSDAVFDGGILHFTDFRY